MFCWENTIVCLSRSVLKVRVLLSPSNLCVVIPSPESSWDVFLYLFFCKCAIEGTQVLKEVCTVQLQCFNHPWGKGEQEQRFHLVKLTSSVQPPEQNKMDLHECVLESTTGYPSVDWFNKSPHSLYSASHLAE